MGRENGDREWREREIMERETCALVDMYIFFKKKLFALFIENLVRKCDERSPVQGFVHPIM
jgi:hypothetical protein